MGADGSGDASGEDSELTGIDEARRRIAAAARTGATVLDLGDLRLTEMPEEIAALTGLTSLDLWNNEIGDEGARALTALTGLTSLRLASNQIGDDGARAIAALTGLTSLDLGYNQVGGDGARAIAALSRLTSLNLRSNRIGDDGARAIAALTCLTSLDLRRNRIEDHGARVLLDAWAEEGMSQLRRLYLHENDFDDIGIPSEIIRSSNARAIFAAYRAREQDDIEPEIPASQAPGYQFALQTDGRIDLQPSGLAPPDELAEILAMRGVIIEALDDLIPLLAGTNAYSSVAAVAERYKSAISAGELSIDLLYGYGVRLENSRSRLEIEIANGDYPDMAPAVGEALDSVIALHGPVVYSTARGRELVERARSFELVMAAIQLTRRQPSGPPRLSTTPGKQSQNLRAKPSGRRSAKLARASAQSAQQTSRIRRSPTS